MILKEKDISQKQLAQKMGKTKERCLSIDK